MLAMKRQQSVPLHHRPSGYPKWWKGVPEMDAFYISCVEYDRAALEYADAHCQRLYGIHTKTKAPFAAIAVCDINAFLNLHYAEQAGSSQAKKRGTIVRFQAFYQRFVAAGNEVPALPVQISEESR